MLCPKDIEALLDQLQDFALGSDGDAMSERQVAAAIGLLNSVLPDLHEIRLSIEGLQFTLSEAATHSHVEA